MTNYIPFLKTKRNEFSAIKNLDDDIAMNITPFFDINRKENKNETEGKPVIQSSIPQKYTENEYKDKIRKLVRKFELNLTKVYAFYLDDYDIDDELCIDEQQSYGFVIENFSSFNFIPVIGINRDTSRNSIVFEKNQLIKSSTVAIRLEYEDIQTGILEMKQLITLATQYFSQVELIIDMRIMSQDINIREIFTVIAKFLSKSIYPFSKIIISGSSITKVPGEIIDTKTIKDIPRKELELFSLLNSRFADLIYGDYTIISPCYSDLNIDPRLLPGITAAKVIYSYGNYHHFCRGEILETGGSGQYNKFCKHIFDSDFYRGKDYSFGDNFIYNAIGKTDGISPGSILNPTINAHISYMYKDYQL